MSYEEKRTWIYLVSSVAAYGVYLAIVLDRATRTPLTQVPYVSALLWATGASIVASIVGGTVVDIARPGDSRHKDVRDKEIARFGEHTGRWFVIAAAAAAFVMAIARWDYFWIANVIYLGFVLWAIVGSVVRLVAYRRGLSPR
jgi:hypothetical protein